MYMYRCIHTHFLSLFFTTDTHTPGAAVGGRDNGVAPPGRRGKEGRALEQPF
jgi:hypothetical protein